MIRSMKILFFLLVVLFFPAFNVVADQQHLIERLEEFFPEVSVTRVSASPIEGIYEIIIGADVLYMTSDARFILKGDLLDMQERRNLSKDLREHSRAGLLRKVSADEYIEFAPENSKYIIYAFTDVDCGYCRKLHQDIPRLNNHGITIRYLAYPRGGVDSYTYKKMVNVWCAEDRPQALTDAKNGILVAAKDCRNPVKAQYDLGGQLGVSGTPAIFFESGRILPGYAPPDTLLSELRK